MFSTNQDFLSVSVIVNQSQLFVLQAYTATQIFCELTTHQRRLYRMIRGEFASHKLKDVSHAKLHMVRPPSILIQPRVAHALQL